ncbi:MAG TPA: TraR/DksA C4-type zinc finger protein [Noviherbaspirillum sp.]
MSEPALHVAPAALAPGMAAQVLLARLQSRRDLLAESLRQRMLSSGQPALECLAREEAQICSCVFDVGALRDSAMRREVSELRDIERALQRLEEGRYGRCVQCGGPIEPERLAQRPEADWCQVCKHAFEARRGLAPAGV